MESLGYLFAYLLKRENVTWGDIKEKSENKKNQMTLDMKLSTKPKVCLQNARM